MKNKKKNKIIIIISVLLIAIVIGIIIFNKNEYNGEPFYLNDKYYSTGNFIMTDAKELEELIDKKETFLLFVYNNFCTLPIPCETIFLDGIKDYKIDALQITFDEFKNTNLYNTIKLAPSFIIIKDGKIIDYLKADSDDDLDKYQDIEEFKNWLNKYILLKN